MFIFANPKQFGGTSAGKAGFFGAVRRGFGCGGEVKQGLLRKFHALAISIWGGRVMDAGRRLHDAGAAAETDWSGSVRITVNYNVPALNSLRGVTK